MKEKLDVEMKEYSPHPRTRHASRVPSLSRSLSSSREGGRNDSTPRSLWLRLAWPAVAAFLGVCTLSLSWGFCALLWCGLEPGVLGWGCGWDTESTCGAAAEDELLLLPEAKLCSEAGPSDAGGG
jgi:hypothetical protein